MTFKNLHIAEPILQALSKKGYHTPTPIQGKSIPHLLEGRDVFGCAQTGTGKTAAFAIPIIQKLAAQINNGPTPVKALILAPTRELVLQIAANFKDYSSNMSMRQAVIYGGVSQGAQVAELQRNPAVVIATPGRLLDLMSQGKVSLKSLEFLVLDEADRMLDMGFINDIKKIVARIPAQRQTILFSATVPPAIKKLADALQRNPVMVSADPVSSASGNVEQVVYYVERNDKRALLRHVLKSGEIAHALVFTRTKRGADKVSKELNSQGIRAEAIHGNKSQNAREKALKNFKSRNIRVLVATDIASRGIDVDKLSHVINFELPEMPETYVHRIGRTGRAGSSGQALSFCSAEERDYLKGINKLLKTTMPAVAHPYNKAS